MAFAWVWTDVQGFFSRLFVNYDVCIAYLVADSMEVNTNCVNAVCPFFLKTIRYNDNPVLLDRMAQVNYLLVYHKVMDDIMDDNSVKAKVTARLMRNKYLQIAQHNRMAAKCIVTWMKAIREMEERQAYVSLDQAALPFGRLLEGVMATCVNDPLDAQVFGTFCKWLGHVDLYCGCMSRHQKRFPRWKIQSDFSREQVNRHYVSSQSASTRSRIFS